ncbi:apolipoprotein N-acyltransferase [Desulfococcus sp.]|uniref:apolipoprotein N-acyltransferase n=1 Tax=Desulfococcus sp. TaxID=2025834 RepID=UPI003592FD59
MLKRKTEWTDDLLAGAAGVLLTAAHPDVDMHWVAWFALAPLMTSLRGASARTAFRRGMVAGMVHYLTLIYWLVYTMRTYGGLPWHLAVPPLILLSAYLSIYVGLFAMVWARLAKGVFVAVFAAPALWTGLEYLRSFLFSGFPWGLLGYSQYGNLHLIQISDIFGVYGVSFLIVLGNAAVFFAAAHLAKSPWRGRPVKAAHAAGGLLAALIAVGGSLAYGTLCIRSTERMMETAPSLRAAVVQGNIDQMIKWDPAFQEQTTEKYLALSRSIDPGPDLVVWPETAVPFYLFDDAALTERVIRGVQETGAHFVIGSPAFSQSKTGIDYFNSAYLVAPDGRPAGRYDKVHLVPFGEYVPLQEWLPFIRKLVVQVGDFKTGEKGKTLGMAGPRHGGAGAGTGARLGVLICYEIIFPDLSRAAAANGAGLLVNVTNDAWYGRSSAPYQHFSMAVFRAVENKRALIRSANTGISGFIDPVGRVEGSTPLFVDAAVTRAVPVLTRKTPYTRAGDWFAAACSGIAVMMSCIATFRRKTP